MHICMFYIKYPKIHAGSATTSDGVLEYSREVFSQGLLYLEFHDAIKEGDGLRVLRCWKYMMLLFKASQRKNYAIESFNCLCQFFYYFSPQMAQQLLYSRFVNVHGREGCNIPCDLHMEHLNRVIKDALQHLGANKTQHAITRASKCSHLMSSLLSQFDATTGLKAVSTSHTRASERSDVDRMLAVLCNNTAFAYQGTRSHRCFKAFRSNHLITSLDMVALKEWMGQQFQRQ